jgi:hypothetical protein
MLIVLWVAWAGACVQKTELPEFPEYPPTKPFLEEQEQRKRRAAAILEFRRRERLKFLRRSRARTLAAWQPIYDRIAAARASKPRRDLEKLIRRREVIRFPEGTRLADPDAIRAARPQKELRELIRRRKLARFPSGTRLKNPEDGVRVIP